MKEKLKKFYYWSNTWPGTIVIVLLVIFFLAQAFIIPSGSMKKTLLPGDALFAKKFAYGVPIPHIPWIEIPILPDFRGDGHLIDGPRPQDGDIVIFRFPLDVKKHFVKRCFASSGDEVIYDERGFWLHSSKIKDGEDKKVINGKIFYLNPYMKEHKGIQYINQNVTFFALKQRAQELLDAAGIPSNYIGYISYEDIKKIIKAFLAALRLQGINATPQEVDVGLGVYVENGEVKYFYSKLKKDEFLMIGDNRDESFDSRFWGPITYKLVVGKPWFIYMSWDSDFTIRWNRVGKTIDEIEEELREGKRPYITAGCEKER